MKYACQIIMAVQRRNKVGCNTLNMQMSKPVSVKPSPTATLENIGS